MSVNWQMSSSLKVIISYIFFYYDCLFLSSTDCVHISHALYVIFIYLFLWFFLDEYFYCNINCFIVNLVYVKWNMNVDWKLIFKKAFVEYFASSSQYSTDGPWTYIKKEYFKFDLSFYFDMVNLWSMTNNVIYIMDRGFQ